MLVIRLYLMGKTLFPVSVQNKWGRSKQYIANLIKGHLRM